MGKVITTREWHGHIDEFTVIWGTQRACALVIKYTNHCTITNMHDDPIIGRHYRHQQSTGKITQFFVFGGSPHTHGIAGNRKGRTTDRFEGVWLGLDFGLRFV